MSDSRLEPFIRAIGVHGWTTWPDSACGGGGVGGQALTTVAHIEVIAHLVDSALRGATMTEAADTWADVVPGTTRLDGPVGRSRRAGPDGRPLP